ncbi:MAG: DUF3369 domain-containing protein [Proteobacteria bacterium]|nr:DUF3369 domain-containing protein [Pseudomonadota bacterium]
MSNKNDELFFVPDETIHPRGFDPGPDPGMVRPWKIMIVDDEEEVHGTTRMVLQELRFEGRALAFLSAFSGEEAKRLIVEHPDTAAILLDVVMETEDSGLEVARHIRDRVGNHFVRLILRTGHPGQAPEMEVVLKYDINDYKEKGDLTFQKLYTTVIGALRSYRDLRIIDRNRKGLQHIIGASSGLFRHRTLDRFAGGLLTELSALLNEEENDEPGFSGLAAVHRPEEFEIISATGRFESFIGLPVRELPFDDVIGALEQALECKKSLFLENRYVGYFPTRNHSEHLIYLEHGQALSELDRNLVRIFMASMAVAFDNIHLNQEIADTQKEVICTLGEVVETRSKETAFHVKRVAEISRLLALKAGLSEEESELLRQASPMHDVGKVGVPDIILNKPGPLSETEFSVIMDHARIGYEILKNSDRNVMRAAAIVSLQHHERWNGQGYPHGLKGDDIHIFGRITGLVDVFDALSHDRVYKKAWPLTDILEYIRQERGRHFDPRLVDLFLDHLDDFVDILKSYPDD